MTAEQFKSIRTNLNLTQTQFADQMGVHRVTVTRWETGELDIDQRTKLAAEHLICSETIRRLKGQISMLNSKVRRSGSGLRKLGRSLK